MRFSFSRLKSFTQCKYEWKQKYLDKIKGEDNFFTQYGLLMHGMIEKFARGELSIFDLEDYFCEHFWSDVTYDAPYNKFIDISESYFNKGLEFIQYLMEMDLDNYEIVDVEKEIHFDVDGKEFVGYIDMILRNKNTGKYVMVDHKSTDVKFLKKGGISKSNLKDIEGFKHQMYLYSLGFYNEYGEFPEMFAIDLFNCNKIYSYEFNNEEFQESIEWAKSVISDIENEVDFYPMPDFFYCRHLCEYRNMACEYKQ